LRHEMSAIASRIAGFTLRISAPYVTNCVNLQDVKKVRSVRYT